MPVISEKIEIRLTFGFDPLMQRTSQIRARYPDSVEHPVGDITPNVLMIPKVMFGGEIEKPHLTGENLRLHSDDGRVLITPKLVGTESFTYEVKGSWKPQRRGVIYWPIRHPTEQLVFVFAADGSGPARFSGHILQDDKLTENLGCGEWTDDGVIFRIKYPPLKSQVLFAWNS